MGWRCWLWHKWEAVTDFRLPLKLEDAMKVQPVRLDRCVLCGLERGRASTFQGEIDVPVEYVRGVMAEYSDRGAPLTD